VPLYQAKAELFRTLGHPARIRILELLSERDHPVHELLEAIEIEQSNLSQQLAVLRRAGLVSQRREAGAVVYALSVPGVPDLLRTARRLPADVLDDQGTLKAELERSAELPPPTPTPPAATPAAQS
jgi:ArsR family transcriptional regulator